MHRKQSYCPNCGYTVPADSEAINELIWKSQGDPPEEILDQIKKITKFDSWGY